MPVDPNTPAENVGRGPHVVREGEDIPAIAWRYGVDPEELWNHADNAELREHRDRHVLMPGDRVTIPRRAERASFAVAAGQTKRYSAHVPRHEMALVLQYCGEPRRDKEITVEVDGRTLHLATDGDGLLRFPVLPGARFARLVVHDTLGDVPWDHEIHLDIGGLDPLSSLRGQQGRLRALGYPVGAIDGVMGPRTRHAVEEFQRHQGLEVTGAIDASTRDALERLSAASPPPQA